MVGPQNALEDPERPLQGRACRLKLPNLALHDAEVAQRDRDLGALGPVDGLLDRQRSLQVARAPRPAAFSPPRSVRAAAARGSSLGGFLDRSDRGVTCLLGGREAALGRS